MSDMPALSAAAEGGEVEGRLTDVHGRLLDKIFA